MLQFIGEETLALSLYDESINSYDNLRVIQHIMLISKYPQLGLFNPLSMVFEARICLFHPLSSSFPYMRVHIIRILTDVPQYLSTV